MEAGFWASVDTLPPGSVGSADWRLLLPTYKKPGTEEVRSRAAGARLDTLDQDVRHAWRALSHSRGHALWVIGSLSIGMAVMTATLALLNALLVRSFPAVTDQDGLVRVAVSRNCGRPECWLRMSSLDDYDALRQGLTGLQGLTAYAQGEVPVTLHDAQSLRALFASDNYFDVLGVPAAIGRTFDARDSRAHAAVAVLSHAVWTGQMGADPSVIGRSIRVVDSLVEIIGVSPRGFAGIDFRVRTRGPDIWLPLWLADQILPFAPADARRHHRAISFVGRLADGGGADRVQSEADVVASGLAALHDPAIPHGRAEVLPVWMTRPELRPLMVLIILPIPMLMLVIACVNAANLMLARGSQRGREIAIRLAIGAGRWRIVRQLLIESVLLALAATAVAVPLAQWGLDIAQGPLGVPMPLDGTVLAVAVVTAAGTAIAFGLIPALRTTAQQPARVLGPAGAGSSATPRQSFARRAVLVAQVALSIGLLATGWQLVATVRSAGGYAGTPGDRLLIARFDLEPLRLSASETASFYQQLLDRASRVPAVAAAGLARHTAVWTFGRGAAPASLLAWHPGDGPADGRAYIGGYADGDLFDAVGLRLLGGRAFAEGDRDGPPRVAVVNQTLADALGGPAVGQMLRIAARDQEFSSSTEVQIVGVVESAMEPRYTADGRPVPKLYLPSPIGPEPALALYVRSRSTAAGLGASLRQLVRDLDARVPIMELGSLDEINERSFGPQLWLARAAAVLGGLGVLLATAGLYGVASYVVSMRSRELAIRLAIGARPRRVLAMILGDSLRIVCAGLALGGLAAWIVSRVIQSEYHGIVGIDIVAFGGSGALFVAAMLVASALPAVRAARVDPVAALKEG